MENLVTLACEQCGAENRLCVPEAAEETQSVRCDQCGHALGTIGQLHAQVAQEALGLGATDLRDDHVPVDGELGERPGV